MKLPLYPKAKQAGRASVSQRLPCFRLVTWRHLSSWHVKICTLFLVHENLGADTYLYPLHGIRCHGDIKYKHGVRRQPAVVQKRDQDLDGVEPSLPAIGCWDALSSSEQKIHDLSEKFDKISRGIRTTTNSPTFPSWVQSRGCVQLRIRLTTSPAR